MRKKITPQLSPQLSKDESGQAITEYIVMVAVVLGFYLVVARALSSTGLAGKLAAPLQQDFARTYQYGKPTAYGFEDGGPKDHPRIQSSGNFRLFINPQLQ